MVDEISSMDNDKPPSRGGHHSPVDEKRQLTHTISTSPAVSLPHFMNNDLSLSIIQSISLSKNRTARPITRRASPFVVGSKTREFRNRFFAEATDDEWNNWHWQIRNRISDLHSLQRILNLSADEQSAIGQHQGPLPVGITPYYASLIARDNPLQPLRRTVIQVPDEYLVSPEEEADPLNEDADSPVPGLVHRYPDRVLFLTTGFCSVYCRYCTRSRLVGNKGGEYRFNLAQMQAAINYIRRHHEVRDVLISGGDPLTLPNSRLEWLLSELRSIPHVEMLRIGTKVPAVLPQRITSGLVNMLKKYHPLWMSIHFTHPDELTPETAQACARLADAGIPLGSQTVLLKGVNDSVDTLKSLFQGLLKIRVRPYYLYQCDPVLGSSHFRTSISKGLEMIAGLRGHTTGYAVPTYVVDAPGGGGKIPLLPDYVISHQDGNLVMKNYKGLVYRYPDPSGESASDSTPNFGRTE